MRAAASRSASERRHICKVVLNAVSAAHHRRTCSVVPYMPPCDQLLAVPPNTVALAASCCTPSCVHPLIAVPPSTVALRACLSQCRPAPSHLQCRAVRCRAITSAASRSTAVHRNLCKVVLCADVHAFTPYCAAECHRTYILSSICKPRLYFLRRGYPHATTRLYSICQW